MALVATVVKGEKDSMAKLPSSRKQLIGDGKETKQAFMKKNKGKNGCT